MAYNVKFLQGSAASYAGLVAKDTNTFYYVDGKDLYLGNIKLSNGADLDAAIVRIAANEQDIVNIKKQLETLTGTNLTALQEKINKHDTELKRLESAKADKATTLAGYGIGDAYTKTEVEGLVNAVDAKAVKNAEDIAAETLRAQGIEAGLREDVNALDELSASNAGRLDVLEGEATTEGSVKYEVARSIAEVINEAPEDFDTLKEIADYIANDKTGAAELSNKIAANETAIATEAARAKKAEEELGSKVDAAQGAAEAAQAHSEGVAGDLATEASERKAADEAFTTQISGLQAAVDKAATKEELQKAKDDQATVDEEQTAKITALQNAVGESENLAADIEAAKQGAITAANEYTDTEVEKGKQAAINAAATDATGKANTAEQNAKNYADSLAGNYATKEQGILADTAVQNVVTGNTNGTISITKGTTTSEVAVKGLASAAFVEASSFDTAGSASAAQTNAEAHSDANLATAKTYAEGQASTALTQAQAYTDNALSWGQIAQV